MKCLLDRLPCPDVLLFFTSPLRSIQVSRRLPLMHPQSHLFVDSSCAHMAKRQANEQNQAKVRKHIQANYGQNRMGMRHDGLVHGPLQRKPALACSITTCFEALRDHVDVTSGQLLIEQPNVVQMTKSARPRFDDHSHGLF